MYANLDRKAILKYANHLNEGKLTMSILNHLNMFMTEANLL